MPGPVVIQHEIVDHQRAAWLHRFPQLTEYRDIVGGRLLVRDMTVDRVIISGGPKVTLMEIAIDRLEAISNSKSPDELARDRIHVGPIQLIPGRLPVDPKPGRRPDARTATDIEPRHR